MAPQINEDLALQQGPALDQFRTHFGRWDYGNSTDLITTRFRNSVPADIAIKLYDKDDDPVARLVMVDWIPGELDGSRGIGEATIGEHVAAIYRRRNVNTPNRIFPSLSTNPSYGYCGTDPFWFMRKHADTSHVPNTLRTYSAPSEAAVVKDWLGWNSLAGAQLVNPHPASEFYLAASNRDIIQGGQYGPSAYDKPRNAGWTGRSNNRVINPEDVTSFHPGQHNWDITNMPAIMYQLHPTTVDRHPENWPKPPQMRDVDGNPMFDPADLAFPILDWTILPFRISTNEDPCVMAAWLRLDPRMSWNDIIARMIPDGRPTPNVLNMRVSRLNASLDIFQWRDSFRSQQKVENEIKKGKRKPLTIFHTLFNTTRGLTPGWSWTEFDKHVPVTELKWIEFKGKLTHLNGAGNLVGWKYKPDVDDEKLHEFEIYKVWYQYPASVYVDRTCQGGSRHPTPRGRPTIPSALAHTHATLAHATNNHPTKSNSCKRRRSLFEEAESSKKQRNVSSITTSDIGNAVAQVDIPVTGLNHNSYVDAVDHSYFNEELLPREAADWTCIPELNEHEKGANQYLDEWGPEGVLADIFDQVCQGTGLDDYGLYTDQNLHDVEPSTNNFGNEVEHDVELLGPEFILDSGFIDHDITDHFDLGPAIQLLESDPRPYIPCRLPVSPNTDIEVVRDASVPADPANSSIQGTYATESEEPQDGDNRDLTLNEENFHYIADANIINWLDPQLNDPKQTYLLS